MSAGESDSLSERLRVGRTPHHSPRDRLAELRDENAAANQRLRNQGLGLQLDLSMEMVELLVEKLLDEEEEVEFRISVEEKIAEAFKAAESQISRAKILGQLPPPPDAPKIALK